MALRWRFCANSLKISAAGLLCAALLGSFSTAEAKDHRAKKPAAHHGNSGAKHQRHSRSSRSERAVSVYTRAGLPNIQAHSALILDLGAGGLPLYQKNSDEERPIASISKLMAMTVVLERKLDTAGQTTISASDARLTTRGAKSRLKVGATLSNLDLLHAALMASDNRAVLALGRAVGLEPTAFAAAMSAKAKSLGLKHTHFADPTGLDYRNVSTTSEVIAMLQAALKQPLIAQICRTSQHVAHTIGRPHDSIEYSNTDLLLRGSRHLIHGGKTGYNDRAGYCFVVAARVQLAAGKFREVAMVFLGADGKLTRFADFGRAAQWLVERAPEVRTVTQSGLRDTSKPRPTDSGLATSAPQRSLL